MLFNSTSICDVHLNFTLTTALATLLQPGEKQESVLSLCGGGYYVSIGLSCERAMGKEQYFGSFVLKWSKRA